MALELAVLLAIAILGSSVFAVFEIETPGWRKALKWCLVTGVTLGLYGMAGHWALLFPLGAGIAGTGFHIWWCRRHGIDALRATPRRRYYQLRGWTWID
jgi:hypothetical protein